MRMDPFGWLYGFERLTINQAGLFYECKRNIRGSDGGSGGYYRSGKGGCCGQ
jgi:hypothetical protein